MRKFRKIALFIAYVFLLCSCNNNELDVRNIENIVENDTSIPSGGVYNDISISVNDCVEFTAEINQMDNLKSGDVVLTLYYTDGSCGQIRYYEFPQGCYYSEFDQWNFERLASEEQRGFLFPEWGFFDDLRIHGNNDKVLSNSGKLGCRVITKVANIESNDYNKDIILWGNDLLPYVFVLEINSRNRVGEIYVNELNNISIFSETVANSENKEYIHERDIESGNWSKFYTWDESGSLIWCLVTSQYVIYKYPTGNEYYIKYDNQVKILPHEFIDGGLSEYSTISLKDITGDGIEELFYWPCKDCALKPILILDPVECKDISYFRFVIEDSPVRRLYLKPEYIEEIKNIIEEHPEINQEFDDLIEKHSVEQELDGWRLYGTSNSRDVFFIKYVKENLSLEVHFEYLGDGFYITSLVYNDDVISDMIINLKTK